MTHESMRSKSATTESKDLVKVDRSATLVLKSQPSAMIPRLRSNACSLHPLVVLDLRFWEIGLHLFEVRMCNRQCVQHSNVPTNFHTSSGEGQPDTSPSPCDDGDFTFETQ